MPPFYGQLKNLFLKNLLYLYAEKTIQAVPRKITLTIYYYFYLLCGKKLLKYETKQSALIGFLQRLVILSLGSHVHAGYNLTPAFRITQ